MSQKLLGGEITQRLMGTDGVVGSFPGLEFAIQLGDRERAGGDLIELLGVGTLGALHLAIELGGTRGPHEEAQTSLGQAASKTAASSPPPTTGSARTGKGRRRCKVSRNKVAAVEVARRCTSITSQRETGSRAVNCFRTTPGEGRKSRVSSCTRSPGFSTA